MPLRLLFCLLLFYAFGLGAQSPLTVTVEETDLTCFGVNDGIVELRASGGTKPYSGANFDENGYAKIANRPVGNYSYTISDANGQTVVAEAVIAQPNALKIQTTSITGETLEKGGSVSVSVNGGTKPYSYLWTNGATTSATDGLEAGDYEVVVTDANNCTVDLTVVIQDQVPPLEMEVSTIDASCNGAKDGIISISVTGGAPDYGGDFPESGQLLLENQAPGTYSFTVVDQREKTKTVEVTITEPDPVSATAETLTHLTAAGPGSLTVAGTGGTGTYTYAWEDGSTGTRREDLPAGTYTVTVTDENDCTGSQSFTIEDRIPELTVTVVISKSNEVSCFNGADGAISIVTDGGVPPYSGDVSAEGTMTFGDLAAGEYKYTVKDDRGVEASVEVTLLNPDELVASSGGQTNVTVEGKGSATVSVTGGTGAYKYAWSKIDATSATATDLEAGDYTVTVIDENGCTATQKFTITDEIPALTASATTTGVSCFGQADGTVTVTPTGGLPPYTISTTDDEEATFENLAPGDYTYKVTDDRGTTAEVTATIVAPKRLVAGSSGQANVTPDGLGSATVGVTGGTEPYTYVWSDNPSTSATATELQVGDYTATVTDANGCTATQQFSIIDQTAPLAITLDGTTPASCFGTPDGSATITVTGGVTPYTGDITAAGTTTIDGLVSAIYIYSVTDARGVEKTVEVPISSPPEIVVDVTDVVKQTIDQLGSASIEVSGGTGDYTYAWNDANLAGSELTDVKAGTYTVTVTDKAGCSVERAVNIPDGIPLPTFEIITFSNPTCSDSNDGSITFEVTGGVPPYHGQMNAKGDSTYTGLGHGAHKFKVFDARDSMIMVSYAIVAPFPLKVDTVDLVDERLDFPGSIILEASGGTAPYTFTWQDSTLMSDSLTNDTLTGLTAGVYPVTVTDANGCTVIDSFTVADLTSIRSLTLDKVDIYPTVVHDRLNVALGAEQQIRSLTVIAASGKVFSRRAYANARQLTLQRSELPTQTGTYFLYIETASGRAGTYRFVIP